MPKGGERVAPPRPPGGYEVRFLRSEAVKGWQDLCAQVPNAAHTAYQILATKPCDPTNHDRQHRLKGDLAYVQVNGVMLEQWQLEVTGGGRLWYAVNSSTMEVWLSLASTKHPKATE